MEITGQLNVMILLMVGILFTAGEGQQKSKELAFRYAWIIYIIGALPDIIKLLKPFIGGR